MMWHVYELFDPRNGKTFYVGCTTTPLRRINEHGCDRASSAWGRIQEIRAAGFEHYMRIVAEFDDKKAAYALEQYLIGLLPNLVNKPMGSCVEGCGCGKHHPQRFAA